LTFELKISELVTGKCSHQSWLFTSQLEAKTNQTNEWTVGETSKACNAAHQDVCIHSEQSRLVHTALLSRRELVTNSFLTGDCEVTHGDS